MYYRAIDYKAMGQYSNALLWMKKAVKSYLRGNKKSHSYYEVFDEIHLEMMADQLNLGALMTIFAFGLLVSIFY